jgi:hypothetical protein
MDVGLKQIRAATDEQGGEVEKSYISYCEVKKTK